MEELKKQVIENTVLLREVKDNHLTHIYTKLEKLDARVWWILSVVILGFLTSITLLLLR